jgi:hypothetical protein
MPFAASPPILAYNGIVADTCLPRTPHRENSRRDWEGATNNTGMESSYSQRLLEGVWRPSLWSPRTSMHGTECLALHVLCRLSKSGSQPHDPVWRGLRTQERRETRCQIAQPGESLGADVLFGPVRDARGDGRFLHSTRRLMVRLLSSTTSLGRVMA